MKKHRTKPSAPQKKTPSKPGFFARLFGKKATHPPVDPSVYHKPWALEPYHKELTAPTTPPTPQAKAFVPPVSGKESKGQTLISHQAPTVQDHDLAAPTPVQHTPTPQKETPTPKDATDSIVGNIMQQSAEHTGRKKMSGDTMHFTKPKVQDHQWFLNTLSYTIFLLVLVIMGGWIFFYIELDLENNIAQEVFRRPSVGRLYQNKTDVVMKRQQEVGRQRRLLTEMEQRLRELEPGQLTYDSLPFLKEVRTINQGRVNWQRALDGINDTVARAGGAQDFLRQLTYQGFTFTTGTKQITLGSPVVRGVYYEEETADVIGSSISLATRVIQLFEESAYFKDLKQLTFSRSEITDADSEFGLFQNFQTPIVLNMTYQSDGERDCRDANANCFGISTLPTTTPPTTAPASDENTPIQRQ